MSASDLAKTDKSLDAVVNGIRHEPSSDLSIRVPTVLIDQDSRPLHRVREFPDIRNQWEPSKLYVQEFASCASGYISLFAMT
jgi:hypothetical protein